MPRIFKQDSRYKTIQGKAITHESGRKSVARTSVPVIQAMPAANAVIQRYTVEEDIRFSQNRQLAMDPNGGLYASHEMFEQANSINGSIKFRAVGDGPENLNKVEAFVVEGSDLAKTLAGREKTDIEGLTVNEKDFKELKSEAVRTKFSTLSTLEDDFESIFIGHMEDGEVLTENVAKESLGVNLKNKKELKLLITKLATAAVELIENVDIPLMEQKVDSYLQSQNLSKPFMPSDCRIMASAILGFEVGSHKLRDKVNPQEEQIVAGHFYEANSDHKDGEWPYHYAAVIMADGADHVTMENAAAKLSEKFSKAEYDTSWFFEMYGPEEKQTFAYKYGKDMDPENGIKPDVFKPGNGKGFNFYNSELDL